MESKHYKKLRKLKFLFVLLLLLMVLPLSMAVADYKLTIDVDFDSNLIFSRYDVDLYYKGRFMHLLKHGNVYHGILDVDEGPGTLFFCKHDDKSLNSKIDCVFTGDTSISCKLHCYKDKIDLSSVSVLTQEPEETVSSPLLSESPSPQITPVITETPISQVSYTDVDLHSMTDDELEKAISEIKEEQRGRKKTRIVIDETDIKLAVGKTMKIVPDIQDLPEGEPVPQFEWDTSDKRIVTVVNGLIKAVSEGSAVITCRFILSDGVESSCECTVETYIPVASISVMKREMKVSKGESALQDVRIKPANATDKSVSYSSSDENVVAVSNDGSLIAKNFGNAVITVSSNDGSGVSQKYTVIVPDPDINNKDSFPKNIAVGDIVYFGNYYQKSPKSVMTPIEWVVLERNKNKILLLSIKSLDYQPFHNNDKGAYWPNSSIRKWLNNDFYNIAFTKDEKSAIMSTSHTTCVYYANKTTKSSDKVFLLDFREAEKYFKLNGYFGSSDYEYFDITDHFIMARPTHLAGNPYGPPANKSEWDYADWLLRTNSTDNKSVVVITTNGYGYGGNWFYMAPCDKTFFIRPAITLDVNRLNENIITKKLN